MARRKAAADRPKKPHGGASQPAANAGKLFSLQVCVSMVGGCEECRGAEHEVRGMHFMPQALLSAFRAGHIGSAEEQGAIRRPHFLQIKKVSEKGQQSIKKVF